MSSLPSYYHPYESDNDRSSDESTDQSSEDETDEVEDDPRYALHRAAGPSFFTQEKQKEFDINGAAPYDTSTDITSFENHVYLDPPKTTKTSLVSIKSINRDKSIFPTPYKFQIKLPRTYKNVTKFQMVQMSFPNNNSSNAPQVNLITSTIVQNLLLNGVPSSCISDCIGVINCTGAGNSVALIEQGRVNSANEPLLITLSVSEGQYTDGQLANEITFKANSTPPMNIIAYERFRDIFMATRQVSALFNEPGDGFTSAVTNRRFGQHTKEDIMSVYYSQHDIDSLPEITETIAFNAYYYPVLKELIATGRAAPFLKCPPDCLGGMEELRSRVMDYFEGLESPFYEAVGRLNRPALDGYRRYLTFEMRNINRYQVLHQPNDQRYRVVHDKLHTSLQRELSGRYHTLLNQQIALAQWTPYSFQMTLSTQNAQRAVYQHLKSNLSTVMSNYYMADVQYDGGDTYLMGSTVHQASTIDSDPDFSAMFHYTRLFGDVYETYEGAVMTFTSFLDYHSTLRGYHERVYGTASTLSSIYGNTYSEYHRYVSTKYTGILPAKMIETRTYMTYTGVPMTFVGNDDVFIPGYQSIGANMITYNASTCAQICCSTIRNLVKSWYSCLPTAFVIRTPQYRLGVWNILPNSFNLVSTVLNITSTGNLNYLMKINEEQGFNNMDVAMTENYTMSNETTGQVKMVCAKILMAGVGDTGISQTVIQNPSLFENTLGRLDKLEFKIYYDDEAMTPAWLYQPYYLDVTEWNATFQIDEEIGYANRATGWGYKPTVPVPKDPNRTPYLFVTHKDNPNNS